MYKRLKKLCPYCEKKGYVVKVTYKNRENEIFVECENCYTVIWRSNA